jgi:hypothetical protein
MSDRGKGKGKGKGKGNAGRENSLGNRPSPYEIVVASRIPPEQLANYPEAAASNSGASSTGFVWHSPTASEAVRLPHASPVNPVVGDPVTSSDEEVTSSEEEPVVEPTGICFFCRQFTLVRNPRGWHCSNPECGAFEDLPSGESFIGRIATAREEEERERCRRQGGIGCNISGGKKSRKNKKTRKNKTRKNKTKNKKTRKITR